MKSYFSKDFSSLLTSLLNKNPSARPKCKDIKSHSFFKKVDWAKIENCELKAPIQPKVKNQDDIRNTNNMLNCQNVVQQSMVEEVLGANSHINDK